MFTCGPAFFTPFGDGSDPYFSSVILLLAGDSATDLSTYAHTATVGGSITFDSSPSSTNGAIGTTSIRTNGGGAASWLYASAVEWRFNPTYTIDFQIYFDSQAVNWVSFAATDFSRFAQWLGGTGSNVVLQGKYGSATGGSLATGAWHYFRIVADGVNGAIYLDGSPLGTPAPLTADIADKAFELFDLTAGNPDYRFMAIRITDGIARNDPTDLTIPMQTAPWPTS